ncbi:MAG: hypothetical protein Q8O34_12960 [Rhodocyclaceae bacterium]|nr:hypothetical protein [Rhodocyclaceae bacterium]
MTDGDDLLDKADALIRRRRIFIAGAGGAASENTPAEPGQGPSSAAEADDVPVLTRVVTDAVISGTENPQTIPPDRIEALARELLFDRLPAQREALADELAAWLDTDLSQVVLRVMDGITDQMVAQVTAEARSILLPRLQAALEAEEHHGTRQEL